MSSAIGGGGGPFGGGGPTQDGERCPRCGQIIRARHGYQARMIDKPHPNKDDCIEYLIRRVAELEAQLKAGGR